MTLAPGAQLGPYHIVSLLGMGGMGEVYRARDSRLRRDVAIKILPAHAEDGPETLLRFEREARAAAALNHPNIVAVFDVGRQDGLPYIVSELVAGQTLRDILRGGALPERRIIDYALQIANGLAAAHERGVVHRDLKPENLFVTPDNRVKLLDFGLARRMSPQLAVVGADNPTASSGGTLPGMLLGTIGYMSPEQVRGETADQRSDIFSFGAILHEMLTGERAFTGDTPADVITAILTKEPPAYAATNSFVARRLEAVGRHCLAKSPDDRFQSARDIGVSIQIAAVDSADTAPPAGAPAVPSRRSALVLAAAAIALAVPLAVLLATRQTGQPVDRPSLVRFTLTLPENVRIPTPMAQIAVSPDGEHIALTAQSADGTRLWLRSLRDVSLRPLAGTDGATSTPFWSPDSKSIGFAAGRTLKKTTLQGSVQAICALPTGAALGAWNQDGIIIFSAGPGQPLFKVAASGGQPVPVTQLSDGEDAPLRPEFLPDGRHFLYLGRSNGSPSRDIYVATLDSPQKTLLLRNVETAEYAAPGYLFFARDRSILVQPFDPARRELSGEPTALVNDLENSFSVSDTGALVYQSGQNMPSQLTWFDRAGRSGDRVGDPGVLSTIAIAPDQRHVVYGRFGPDGRSVNLWVTDLVGHASSRLTFGPEGESSPAWSPDNQFVAFSSVRQGRKSLYQVAARGGSEKLLLANAGQLSLDDWSRDGRFVLYHVDASRELLALPLDGDRTPMMVVPSGSGHVDEAVFSPDGRWVAYNADGSGRHEVYITRFPPNQDKWQISTDGGVQPRWRGDGKELFFIAPDGTMIATEIRLGDGVEAGRPRALFRTNLSVSAYTEQYAVTADGQRFLVMEPVSDTRLAPVTAVLNWPALTKQ